MIFIQCEYLIRHPDSKFIFSFGRMTEIKTISILGCGWYGKAVGESLYEAGYIVKGSSTKAQKFSSIRAAGIEPYLVKFETDSEEFDPDFFKCDVLIISIPPKRREGEAPLYTEKIKKVRDALLQNGPERVIFISSTSVYGDINAEVDENLKPEPDSESGRAILSAENLLREDKNISVSVIRFGGLFGPGRDPARFFSGKKNIPNGNAPVNLIHLDDCTGITRAIVEKGAFGYTFNACSPHHPSKSEFYTRAAAQAGLEAPQFIPELCSWKIVNSVLLEPVLSYKISSLY